MHGFVNVREWKRGRERTNKVLRNQGEFIHFLLCSVKQKELFDFSFLWIPREKHLLFVQNQLYFFFCHTIGFSCELTLICSFVRLYIYFYVFLCFFLFVCPFFSAGFSFASE